MRVRAVSGVVLSVLGAGCTATPAAVVTAPSDRWDVLTDPAVKAIWDRAQVEIQAGRDAAAVPLLREVVERAPDFVPGHLGYQDAATGLGGDAATAMRTWYRDRTDDNPAVAYARARLLSTPFEQFEALQRILRRDPEFHWAWLSSARLQRGRGQSGDAAAAYRQVLARRGDQLVAHLELAETLVDLGLHADAATHYQNYLRGAPNDQAVTRGYVALLVYRLGRAKEALPWIERLLARDPRDEGALMDQAAATWRSGQPQQALALYLRLLERRPGNARAALNIGFLYYDAFGKDEASQRRYWPKARKAFRMFLQNVRPEEGMDYLEQQLAVPFRLQEIARLLGPEDGAVPTVQDLR